METSLASLWQRFLALLGPSPYLQAAALLAISLVTAKLADWIISRVIAMWARRTESDLDDRFIAALHRPVFVSVVLVGLWLAASRLGLPPAPSVFLVRSLQTVALLIWLVFAFRVCSIVLEIVSRLERRTDLIQPRTVPLFDKTVKLVLLGAAVYLLCLVWGINVGAWLLSAGVVGIAVGFAAKDTLANLFSGIFILADAPYQLGDFIILDSGERGRVTQIGLRSTRLLTRDDVEITLPNAVIANAKITNESGGPWQKERIRVKVGVAYGSDVDRVREVLLEIALEHPQIEAEPAPRVRFRAFGESSLDFELLGWVGEPVLRGRVIDSLLTSIYKRFGSEGIEIPYPQRDVHIRSSGGEKAS